MIFTCGKRARSVSIARRFSSRRSRPSQSTVTTSCSFALRRSSSSALSPPSWALEAHAWQWTLSPSSAVSDRRGASERRRPSIAHPHAHRVPGKDRPHGRVSRANPTMSEGLFGARGSEAIQTCEPPAAKLASTFPNCATLVPMARILLIDDDASLLDALSLTFEDAGYDVLTAPDGQRGLEVVKKEKLDAIISDVNMPGLDGFSLCKKLREGG